MGKVTPLPETASTEAVIARILNECQHSAGVHARRAKELLAWRSQHNDGFLTHFWKWLLPIFTVFKREPAAERLVKFVVTFITLRDEKHGAQCDAFLEEFFGLLLFSSDSANRAVRLRACQILSEIILRLNENAEVSDEVWDDVIESMLRRMQDKVPAIRVYSARALARFANADGSSDSDNDSILSAYRRALEHDQNAEVRRNIILSMPTSNATVHDIVRHTSDVNEAVRKTAFLVLSNKCPIQSLSIKQRATVLQRGLHDRAETVQSECLKMLKDVWLIRCCQGDSIALLKYLDVETNEMVGESVMLSLLKLGAINIHDGEGLRKFIAKADGETGTCELSYLMQAEDALYWRVCISSLFSEAQAKGHDAAITGGAQAAINAAAATAKNELLDHILPSTMTDYVQLVKAHLDAGIQMHFVARQLLLVGKFMDFSDATNRKIAEAFLHEIMCLPAGHVEEDDVILGDGVSLGGDKKWSLAVSELVSRVHEAQSEFIRLVSNVVAELGRPCREGGASVIQWINCLAATCFFLENIKSLQQLSGSAIEAQELLGGLLLPAAKHIHPEVQRAAVKSLGIFCTKEGKPSLQAVKQLRLALTQGSSAVQKIASKAFFDLCMWHGAAMLDRIIGIETSTLDIEGSGKFDDSNDNSNLPILEVLAQKLDLCGDETEETLEPEGGDEETLQSVVAEGFAKMMLQSKTFFSDILPLQQCVLTKMLELYFSEEIKHAPRLRQCLAMFFETYPSVSLDHKSCIAKSFLPVIRAQWPGVYGNKSGTQAIATAKRKHVTKLSNFMLQLLHQPLFEGINAASRVDANGEVCEGENGSGGTEQSKAVLVFDEELAIRIAAEVATFPSQRSAAAKSYLAMLSKVLCSLQFRRSKQELIKCMRRLLDNIKNMVSGDKQAGKELQALVTRFEALDDTPEVVFPEEELQNILCSMDVEEPKNGKQSDVDPKTPAAAVKGRTRRRKKVGTPESPSESPPSTCEVVPSTITRTQRASKTAAMGKMRSNLAPSKRAIYGSSDEDLMSSSGSESEKEEDSTYSEFEPDVLLESTNHGSSAGESA